MNIAQKCKNREERLTPGVRIKFGGKEREKVIEEKGYLAIGSNVWMDDQLMYYAILTLFYIPILHYIIFKEHTFQLKNETARRLATVSLY